MNLKEVLIKTKERLKFDSFSLTTDTVILPNNKEKDRTYIKHPGGVAILAITSDKNVLIVNQYRHAIGLVTKEIPAGKMDKSPMETIEQSAQRELQEETGFAARKLIHLGHTYPSAGILDEKLELFFAIDLIESSLEQDDDEFINLEFINQSDFEEMIKNNSIDDAKTVTAYYLAKLKNLI